MYEVGLILWPVRFHMLYLNLGEIGDFKILLMNLAIMQNALCCFLF